MQPARVKVRTVLTPAPSYFKTLSASEPHGENPNCCGEKEHSQKCVLSSTPTFFRYTSSHPIKTPSLTTLSPHHHLPPSHIEPEAGHRQIRQGDVPGHGDGRLRGGHEAHRGCRGHRAGRDGGLRRVQGVPNGHQVEGRDPIDVETVRRDVGGIHLEMTEMTEMTEMIHLMGEESEESW